MLLKLIIPVTEQLYIRNKTSGPEHVPCLQVLLYHQARESLAKLLPMIAIIEARTDMPVSACITSLSPMSRT